MGDGLRVMSEMADAIERGDHEGIRGAVVVLDAPTMPVFGFGNAPPVVATELLACARLVRADALDL
jgi:hypothetical protein